jgi:hypothetical protein
MCVCVTGHPQFEVDPDTVHRLPSLNLRLSRPTLTERGGKEAARSADGTRRRASGGAKRPQGRAPKERRKPREGARPPGAQRSVQTVCPLGGPPSE